MKLLATTIALTLAAPAVAQSDMKGDPKRDTISIKDATAFFAQMRALGYDPTALDASGDTPSFGATFENFTTTVRMIGCTAGKDCKYVTFVTSYTDIVAPPADWVVKMNDEFDLLKVGVNDKKQLYMFAAYPVEGMPVATFRQLVSYWLADTAAIGDEATKANLVTKPK